MGDFSKEGEMLICKDCGFVGYRIEDDSEEKMKLFYKKEYRPAPTISNLITTNHKLQYVRVFLKEYLELIKDKKILFGDIGCATGYLLAFFKALGHTATGCEYTLTFRRFCEKWYGIPIPEELYKKKPYDLLSLYHVLEHMIDPLKKIREYSECLKEDGQFLISTPQWLNVLEEASGSPISTFEGLYPRPHINVFTENSLKNIFRKGGLEIVKEDHVQYGQTYLLKKGHPGDFVKEDYKVIEDKLRKTKLAIDTFKQKNDPEKAIEIWPLFPEAWIDLIYNKTLKDPQKQMEVYKKGQPLLKDNGRWNGAIGWWHFQHKRYEESLNHLRKLMALKPNEETAMLMGACFMESNQWDMAFSAYNEAQSINPQKWAESMSMMCKAASMCQTWDERALAQILKETSNNVKPPEFSDKELETIK